MQEQASQQPSAMNHAMLSGLELGFWLGVRFILEAQQFQHQFLGIISWFVALYVYWGMYVSAQHYKSTECGGKLPFRMGYRYVLSLMLCTSLIASVIRLAYLLWFDDVLLPTMYEQTMQMMEQLFAGQNEALQPEAVQALFTPVRFTLMQILNDLFTGVVFGPIIALVASRRDMNYFKQQ